jgi:hypothetical protein
MANTMTLIASSTVGSGGAASIDFSSIPATYTDLQLVASLRNSGAELWVNLKFNNATTNFSMRWVQGSGSVAASNVQSVNTYTLMNDLSTDTANTFASSSLYIPNYAGSTNKSFSVDIVTETNATTAYAQMTAGLWSNTAAINQVTLVANSGTFVQYSTAYLYGVKNA